MLFKADILEKIASGQVDLAFRRWRRPSVSEGGRLRTPVGVLRIGAVEMVELSAVTPEEARRAGYPEFDAFQAEFERDDALPLYRIRIDAVVADERAALRGQAIVQPDEFATIIDRFERWDRVAARSGYHRAILAIIAERPSTPAGKLAEAVGIDKIKFKRDVRKLKELGLTESLHIGYRLSPRGQSVLALLSGENA
ncbi:ASCH domain-containing protein [Phyllobacterium salinisoli]|uniref:ASCH domain-containing protein n=1 Tax=Phyllobacterium salinisoli TaxID=1899321 RepID=A0A368K5I0_9HYPH|nr:ASCH domain-containing protein [Phyllobacterium salinisoli]RCS24629.1 ASCH domain-containing protein [Phyllobacterium salinisoli]